MDHSFLYGFVVVGMFSLGCLGGVLMGRTRRRRFQRELDAVSVALQHSRTETQQREGAWQRSQQEVDHIREALHQQQEVLRRCQQELLDCQEERGQYRTQVTQHFVQTAELLQHLALQYRAVYDHMAAGAVALCDGQVTTLTAETLRERLVEPPREETPAGGVDAPPPLTAVPDEELHPLTRSQNAADPEKTKRTRINSEPCDDGDDGKTQKLVNLPFDK